MFWRRPGLAGGRLGAEVRESYTGDEHARLSLSWDSTSVTRIAAANEFAAATGPVLTVVGDEHLPIGGGLWCEQWRWRPYPAGSRCVGADIAAAAGARVRNGARVLSGRPLRSVAALPRGGGRG